jgi:hypothetical protein
LPATDTLLPVVDEPIALFLDGLANTRDGTVATADATGRVKKDFRAEVLRFRVGAPFTPQAASLQENQRADTRTVVDRESLDVKNDAALFQVGILSHAGRRCKA